MNKLLIALVLAALAGFAQPGFAQPGLAPPRLGFIAGPDHSLRPVLGLAGNLLLGNAAAEDVLAAAWSGSFGLVKTSSSLMAFDANHILASVDAVPGPALFAFRADGSPALALLPQTSTLYLWTGKAFSPIPFPADWLGGQTLAIAEPQSGQLGLVVQRDDGLWLEQMSTSGGKFIQSALPGVRPPVLLQQDGTLFYANQTALVIRDRAGNERRIETGEAIAEMHWMGNNWVHVVGANGRQLAVRTTPGSEAVSQIPEAR
jgi:hypothetical protein